jgi:hypothetical protein
MEFISNFLRDPWVSILMLIIGGHSDNPTKKIPISKTAHVKTFEGGLWVELTFLMQTF